jgi:hypothetical protein
MNLNEAWDKAIYRFKIKRYSEASIELKSDEK